MTGTLTRPRTRAASSSVSGCGAGLRRRVERAAMPTGRRALHRNSVDAAGHRGRLRLGKRGHGADGRDARVAQPLALLGTRQAERERRHLGPQVEQHVDLGRPGVVVVDRARRAGRRSAPPPEPAPRRTSRSRRAWPHWAAARTNWRRAGRWSRLARGGDPLGEAPRRSGIPPATNPRPPAFVPAAASSGVDGPPAIGATIIRTARSRQTVGIIASHRLNRSSYHGRAGYSLSAACSPKATATSGSWAAGAVGSRRCSWNSPGRRGRSRARRGVGHRRADARGRGRSASVRVTGIDRSREFVRARARACRERPGALPGRRRFGARHSPTTHSTGRCRCWC